jgi:hypothetical protein
MAELKPPAIQHQRLRRTANNEYAIPRMTDAASSGEVAARLAMNAASASLT